MIRSSFKGRSKTCRQVVEPFDEDWIYIVSDGSHAALSLEFYAPLSVESTEFRNIFGFQITLHVDFPSNRKAVARPGLQNECQYLPLGYCETPMISGSAADAFEKEHFDVASGFDQGEAFWQALEQTFASWMSEVTDASIEWTRCTHCEGTGTIPKEV